MMKKSTAYDTRTVCVCVCACVCVCVCVNVITETVAMEIVTCVTKVAVATYYKIVSLHMSCREQ